MRKVVFVKYKFEIQNAIQISLFNVIMIEIGHDQTPKLKNWKKNTYMG